MKAEERAEAILQRFNLSHQDISINEDQWIPLEDLIAAAIREAQDMAYEKGFNASKCSCDDFDEGFSAAREQALEIYRHSGTSEEVESRLKAMTPTNKGFDPCECGTCIECIAMRDIDSRSEAVRSRDVSASEPDGEGV